MFALSLLVLGLAQSALSKTVTYNWSATWVTASPDGFARPVIGINGQWPCPTIEVDIGDQLIVNLHNGLGNQSTGLHFHGLYETGNNVMDGSTGASQCPVPPGSTITYDMKISQGGTYWYHSHNLGQYPDGLRGPLIVHDSSAPFASEFDEEITMTLSDWYHEQMPQLLNTYESASNEDDNKGLEPIPDANLINDGQNRSIPMLPGKTYLVHIINLGNFVGQAIYFDGHPFTCVEVDGVYTQQHYLGTENIRIATGQRWSFLVNSKNSTSTNFAVLSVLDINMFTPPAGYNPNATAYLVYNEKKPLPKSVVLYGFDFFDDVSLVPYDKQALMAPVDRQIVINMNFGVLNGVNRALVNNVTYLPQKVPSLYTALTVGGNYSSNPKVYGVNSNPYVLKYGQVIEIVVNNLQDNLHPWHLHGHNFQVLERPAPQSGLFPGTYSNVSSTPMRRDTIMIQPSSYVVIRFRANNPDKSTS